MTTSTTTPKTGSLSTLKTFFGLGKDQTLRDFANELKQLTSEEKAEMVSQIEALTA